MKNLINTIFESKTTSVVLISLGIISFIISLVNIYNGGKLLPLTFISLFITLKLIRKTFFYTNRNNQIIIK